MSSGATRAVISQIHRFDASEKHTVGRLASEIAKLIIGKHKPTFSPHLNNGDRVIVTNASELTFTGKKYEEKLYRWHTGWPGGLRQTTPRQIVEVKGKPEELLTRAVYGMLPKNKLRDERMKKLQVFKGEEIVAEPSRKQLRRSAWLEANEGKRKFKPFKRYK